jgi:xylulose-5-phosphate/fructose-6-phosphate phosphoketolase
MEALRRSRRPPAQAPRLIEECQTTLGKHRAHVREHFEDLPEIRDWTWGKA